MVYKLSSKKYINLSLNNIIMETKEQLIQNIKSWVKIDNDIRLLNTELAKRKMEKKKISELLMETMKTNEIDVFDINDGRIIYSKRTVKKPVTKKMLLEILSKYYEGDMEEAQNVNNFILDNREVVVKQDIIRRIDKDRS
jgi:hypothetical protein